MLGNLGFLGEYDVHSVIVVIASSHEVVPVSQELECLFADVNALGDVEDTGLNHVVFREVEKINRR